MTGLVERSPRHEQTGLLAVVDDIRFRHGAVSPLTVANGGRSLSPCTGAAPNLFPRRKRNRPVMSDCRALDLGSGAPPTERVLGGGTGGVSLLCRAAVIFVFTLRNQFGDDAVRDVSQLLHAHQHGGHAYAFQGKSFPVSRNEGPRS